MSIWDDIGNQTGITSGYSGLAPDQALQRWYENRNAVAAKYGISPEQLQQGGINVASMAPQDQAAFSMEQLAQQNPDAFRLLQTGRDRVKQKGPDTRQIFNPTTGQWETQEVKGLFSHPETWLQFAAGGAMGAAAPAAIASGAGGGAAGSAGSVGAIEGGAYGLPASSAVLVPGAAAAPSALGGTVGGLGAVAGPTTAAAGGSALSKLAPYLIAGGTDLAGGLIGSKASKDAAKQQMAYGEKAMDAMRNAYGQELGFYGQQRDVYAPYNQIGQSALGNLARLTGNAVPQAPAPNPTMVRLRAPDGSVQAVPESDVQHYIQRGAQIA